MITLSKVKHNLYQDSLKLMKLSNEIKDLPGISEAFAFMGTPMNKEVRISQAKLEGEALEAGSEDLILMVKGEDEENLKEVLKIFEKRMTKKEKNKEESPLSVEKKPKTIDQGLEELTDSNLAIISVPGEYAALEAMKALNKNLNVHMFSDNVSVEDEIYLKETAKEKGLLFMGPDCGTSIINNVPICFANKIEEGRIGIVGASGTGIQEASVIIDRIGSGISHAIGTGGRDLKDTVGGITAGMAMDKLEKDSKTDVILLISKPAGDKTKEIIIEKIKQSSKPYVVVFLGDKDTSQESISEGLYFAKTLEEGAAKAVALSNNESADHVMTAFERVNLDDLIKRENEKKNEQQIYLRGLYTGGSLADETMNILKDTIGDSYSNIPLNSEYELNSIWKSYKNTVVDLGEDEFTKGSLHPMIDPTYRNKRLKEELADPEVSVILCDLVIGYGSHSNPAQAIADAAMEARKINKHYVSIIASVCGTEDDPQNLREQEKILQGAGIIVLPSNQYATELASKLVSK